MLETIHLTAYGMVHATQTRMDKSSIVHTMEPDTLWRMNGHDMFYSIDARTYIKMVNKYAPAKQTNFIELSFG